MPMLGWSLATLIRRLRWGRVQFLALGASLRYAESIPRVGRGWEWLHWPVYCGGGSGGRWHALCRANTGDLVLRWGWERAGSTTEASAGFIGAGAGGGHGCGSVRRGAREVGRWACSGTFRARQTRGGVLLPMFNSSPRSHSVNLGKNLAQASSWHLWLSLVCEFQGKISPRSEDFRMPNLACLPVHSATKEMTKHVKWIWLSFKLF
jgi:hypothetical protein